MVVWQEPYSRTLSRTDIHSILVREEGSGVALGQSMVSSTLLKDQGVKEPTLRLFWTLPGGREEPVPAAAYTHRP